MTPAEVNLKFSSAAVDEEIGTWKDVYGIVKRYRGKVLAGDGKAWLFEVLDERRWSDKTVSSGGKIPDEYLRVVGRHTDKSPYANANFLKDRFLHSCKTVGLFEPIAKGGAAPPRHPSHKPEQIRSKYMPNRSGGANGGANEH